MTHQISIPDLLADLCEHIGLERNLLQAEQPALEIDGVLVAFLWDFEEPGADRLNIVCETGSFARDHETRLRLLRSNISGPGAFGVQGPDNEIFLCQHLITTGLTGEDLAKLLNELILAVESWKDGGADDVSKEVVDHPMSVIRG